MKPKICLISRKFDKNSGSGEWIYSETLKDKLLSKGFEVYTLEQKSPFTNKGRLFHDWIRLPVACLLLRARGVKKFHFLSENQATPVPLLNLFGAETISTFHDLMRIIPRRKGFDYNYFKLIYFLASKSKKIQCNSSQTKRDLLKSFQVSSHIEVIAVNCREFTPSRKTKKEVIGYVGALNPRKRPEKFLEIEKELEKKKKKIQIKIWGKGELYGKIKKSMSSLISLEGFAPEKNLNRIYNSFKYFVFPTSNEGLGMPIIEASMCGIPSFIYEDAKIPQEVKDLCVVCKDSSEIVDKILQLSKDKRQYEMWKKEVLLKSKKFFFEREVNKLIEFYNE